MTLRRSSSLNAIRDVLCCNSSLSSDESVTPTTAVHHLQHLTSLSLLDESQPWMNTVPPALNVPEPDMLNAPLYPPAPFESLDNGQLTTSIQLTHGVALFRAAVALGARPPFIEHHNISQVDVSLQVTPISVQCQEAIATIVAWDRFALMQPKGPTVDNLPAWWRPTSCESYFSEYRKKMPAQQAAGPFAKPAIPSPTPTDEDWQGAIAAAKAAAVYDAQIAQQKRDDAAEARRLQDCRVRSSFTLLHYFTFNSPSLLTNSYSIDIGSTQNICSLRVPLRSCNTTGLLCGPQATIVAIAS